VKKEVAPRFVALDERAKHPIWNLCWRSKVVSAANPGHPQISFGELCE
jgi:hypothetical protein